MIDALRDRDRSQSDPGESTVIELVRLLDRSRRPAELGAVRGELERLATQAQLPVIRQLGFASLVAADGSVDPAWTLASRSPQALEDFLGAMPLIRDPSLRASLYPRVEPLLHRLPASLRIPGGVSGEAQDLIRRAAMKALTSIRGQEVPTFRALARFVRDNVDRHEAILALQKIPAAYWPAEEAKPLLESLITYVRQIPIPERTTPAALDALQLADALVALLPVDQARTLRKELAGLGVRVIRVGTVLEQMRYDVDRIVVQAGKPVEILFENSDMMPHNFVVARPGSLEEIGLQAEATATQAGRPAQAVRPGFGQDPPGQPAAPASRDPEAELHSSHTGGRLSLCLHLSRPLEADVRGPLRRR